MIEDVTGIFHNFVDARRHLWHAYFADSVESVGDERVGVFRQVEKLLFRAMVTIPLGMGEFDEDKLGVEPVPFLVAHIDPSLESLEVLVSTPSSPRTWKRTRKDLTELSDTKLVIVDAFDWFPSGRPTFPLLEVSAQTVPGSDMERWLVEVVNVTIHATDIE